MTAEHRDRAPRSVNACVLTISDSRILDNDSSGAYLKTQLEGAGHRVLEYGIVKDDPDAIRSTLETWLEGEAQVILTTGGTGIAKRDNTVPVVESLLEVRLPGFGELFRQLSYPQVGAAAMLSRATGGLARGRKCLIFTLPGSLNAVQTAWTGIFHDELAHLVFETVR
jgi:molybdenum cofactor biosynthesis protein B